MHSEGRYQKSLSVEWGFLRMVLLEFGFPLKFLNLVMECVTTVQYAFIINGDLTPKFQAKKGPRQGDLHLISLC